MGRYEKAKELYEQIRKVFYSNQDVITISIFAKIEDDIQRDLFRLKLETEYDIKVELGQIKNNEFIRIDENMAIALYDNSRYKTEISRENNDKNLEDELLLSLYFPTGPYLFGCYIDGEKDYPQELFAKFFNELKSYKPDFINVINNTLYWKIKNAKKIFEDFPKIMSKYKELNRKDCKRREKEYYENKIKKLQKEI